MVVAISHHMLRQHGAAADVQLGVKVLQLAVGVSYWMYACIKATHQQLW